VYTVSSNRVIATSVELDDTVCSRRLAVPRRRVNLVLELNYSDDVVTLPAERGLGHHSAGQCSVGDDDVHVWRGDGEIQAAQKVERRRPVCLISTRRSTDDEQDGMQSWMCCSWCHVCWWIQLHASAIAMWIVLQFTEYLCFRRSKRLRILRGLYVFVLSRHCV